MTQRWRERSVITHCVSLPNSTAIGSKTAAENILCSSKEPGDGPLVGNTFLPVSKEPKGAGRLEFREAIR